MTPTESNPQEQTIQHDPFKIHVYDRTDKRRDNKRREKDNRLMLLQPAEDAAEAIGLLKPGISQIGITKGQFSQLDMIQVISDQIGPCDLLISTWTTALDHTRQIGILIQQGRFPTIRLMIDNSFVTRHMDYITEIVRVYGEDNIRQARIHAKFFTMRNEKWNLCVRSSMNLNRNPRLEQYDLDDDPEMCDFFEKIWSEVAEKTKAGFKADRDHFHDLFGGRTDDNAYLIKVNSDFRIDFDRFSF